MAVIASTVIPVVEQSSAMADVAWPATAAVPWPITWIGAFARLQRGTTDVGSELPDVRRAPSVAPFA